MIRALFEIIGGAVVIYAICLGIKQIATAYASKKGKSKGFTLIELLVVIAIVGILSSVVAAAFFSGPKEEESTDQYCERIGRWTSVKDLPASCLPHFSGGSQQR